MITLHRPFSMLAALAAGLVFTSAALPALAVSKKETELAGATLFRDKGCAYCHGANAQGTAKGPSLADVRKTWKAPQIADQIENGGQKMPSFKDSLSEDEVGQLVVFLRAKHRPTPPQAQTPAAMSKSAQ